jgi:hypothetical protein
MNHRRLLRHQSRTRLYGFIAAIVLLLQGVFALGMTSAAPSTSQDDAEARAILENSAVAMANVQSFQFELVTEQGATIIMDTLELKEVTGAVQRPDRFQATATAGVAILDVEVEVIGIGTQVWVKNPISGAAGGEEYIEVDLSEVGGGVEQVLAELANPDRILLRAVELLENPVVRGEVEIGDVQTTVIEGTFDPNDALGLVPGTPEAIDAAATEVATETGLEFAGPVPTLIWIDEDGLVRRIRVEGPILESEAPDVVRRLDIFAYNEPVEIVAPVQ